MEFTESKKLAKETKIKRRIEEKIDAQLKDTYPASDTPNFEAVARDARQEIESESLPRSAPSDRV